MTNTIPASLSDRDLLVETQRAAETERRATARLVALLAEIDTRRLYLWEGFSSLFRYAMQRLHLSEPEAYSRITAARTARRFPLVLTRLDGGALSLTAVSLLAGHLTEENHVALLDAAAHKSKRDVERLVAALDPQPDIAASVRALPNPRTVSISGKHPVTGEAVSAHVHEPAAPELPIGSSQLGSASAPASAALAPTAPSTGAGVRLHPSPCSAVVAPLAPGRYLIRMTLSEETQQKLTRARDLLRHVIPDGDLTAIVDRALTVLLEQMEHTKFAAVARPRAATPSARGRSGGVSSSRHVPASVRRAVWARDQGRCMFTGSDGRCGETGGLEFHHVVPFAAGGPATLDNIQLRCRAHNAFEGELVFGDWRRRTLESPGATDTNSVRTE